jgi:hypothetical protein
VIDCKIGGASGPPYRKHRCTQEWPPLGRVDLLQVPPHRLDRNARGAGHLLHRHPVVARTERRLAACLDRRKGDGDALHEDPVEAMGGDPVLQGRRGQGPLAEDVEALVDRLQPGTLVLSP